VIVMDKSNGVGSIKTTILNRAERVRIARRKIDKIIVRGFKRARVKVPTYNRNYV